MKKEAYFQVITWKGGGGKIKSKKRNHQIKNKQITKKISELQINLLRKIVSKQTTANLHNMCKHVLLFQQKKKKKLQKI